MSPTRKARSFLASALVLLLLSGVAGFVFVTHLLESQKRVIHTQEVTAALGDIDSVVLRAWRARSGYLVTDADRFLGQFQTVTSEIPEALQRMRELTKDNPKQRELCSRLEDLVGRRVAVFRESIQLNKRSPRDDKAQADLERSSLPVVDEINSVTRQMREEEQSLLEMRQRTLHRFALLAVSALSATFILAIALIAGHHRLLSGELRAREEAERLARENEDSLRRLTVRMLQMQDSERRRFSRELHDSLGQSLVGAKMNLEMFAAEHKDSLLNEAIQLLDQSIAETRTISHLLHPPLLEEAGLSAAAKWYLEEFARRSGIEVNTEGLADAGDLPKPVALGLFRILQESLMNIHRHSGSAKAEVAIKPLPDRIVLQVRDYGKGIAPELLGRLQTQGTNSGVGLSGMRERTRELGGHLSIQACSPGTLISATIPVLHGDEATASAAD